MPFPDPGGPMSISLIPGMALVASASHKTRERMILIARRRGLERDVGEGGVVSVIINFADV